MVLSIMLSPRILFPTAILLCTLPGRVPAQNAADLFHQAPPEIDQALRDVISKFFQAHVDGKFREADQWVAEDTKDFYFEHSKPRYLAFRIDKITYSENFTKARATVICRQYIMMPGFAGKPMDVPTPSDWKLENGQWKWWVDPARAGDSPFGKMKPGEGTPGTLPQTLPGIEMLSNKVKVDKAKVLLSASKPSEDVVKLENHMRGPIRITVRYPRNFGLTVTAEPANLNEGGTSTIRFKGDFAEATKPIPVKIMIHPTNQVIPIRVEAK